MISISRTWPPFRVSAVGHRSSVYIYIYISMYIHVYIYIYIYVYIYISTHIGSGLWSRGLGACTIMFASRARLQYVGRTRRVCHARCSH